MIIGTNLTGPVDSSTEYIFSDLMKASRPWLSGSTDPSKPWADGRTLPLDALGNVTSLLVDQVARTAILAGAPKLPPCDIVFTWEGTGTLSFGSQQLYRDGTNKAVVHYRGGELFLDILKTDPANPIKNIKAIINEDGEQFRREVAPFQILRFMDMQFTNGSKQQHWADRPTPASQRYNNKGLPAEDMGIAGRRVTPWVCIPHLADDDYVLNFAKTLKQNGCLNVIVEYSNELWNNAGDCAIQNAYAIAQGKKLGAPNDMLAAYYWNARRAVQVFRIFRTVFARENLICALGAHFENPWALGQMLAFETTQYEIDAVAIAPYFGGPYGHDPLVTQVRDMTVPQLAEHIRANEFPRVFQNVAACRAAVTNPQTKLMAYECGQSLVGIGVMSSDQQLNNLLDNVNRSEAMHDLYVEYLKGIEKAGITHACHFVNVSGYSQWGRWGALEFTGQGTSPKYRALMEAMK